MWRARGLPLVGSGAGAKKALLAFPSHIMHPYLDMHDELQMHMNSFHICWVNWHVGPFVNSIRGVYVPIPYCAIECKSLLYFAEFFA